MFNGKGFGGSDNACQTSCARLSEALVDGHEPREIIDRPPVYPAFPCEGESIIP